MDYNLQNLRNFKETFTLLKEIGDFTKGGDKFLLFHENHMEVVDSITFMNMDGVKYIVALACKIWSNMGYSNRSLKLLGMFDDNFNITRKIPLPNGRSLVNVRFETYRSEYYNEYKPIFEIEGTNMEKAELKIDTDFENGYPDDFLTLYEKALEL